MKQPNPAPANSSRPTAEAGVEVTLVHGIKTNGFSTWNDTLLVLRAVGLSCRQHRYREFHGPALLAFVRVACWPWAVFAASLPLCTVPSSAAFLIVPVQIAAWLPAVLALACVGLALWVAFYEEWDWHVEDRPRAFWDRTLLAVTVLVVLGVFFISAGAAVLDEGLALSAANRLFLASWAGLVVVIFVSERRIHRWWSEQLSGPRPSYSFPHRCAMLLSIVAVAPPLLVFGLIAWVCDGLGINWWVVYCLYLTALVALAGLEAYDRRSAAVTRFTQCFRPGPNRPLLARRAILAHSMGTYVAVQGLVRADLDSQAEHVILLGSPLRCWFDWVLLLHPTRPWRTQRGSAERIGRVRNEVGRRDRLIRLLSLLPPQFDLGSAGYSGFSRSYVHTVYRGPRGCVVCEAPCLACVQNVVHEGEHSSAFLTRGHAVREWVPYLLGFEVEGYNDFYQACLELTRVAHSAGALWSGVPSTEPLPPDVALCLEPLISAVCEARPGFTEAEGPLSQESVSERFEAMLRRATFPASWGQLPTRDRADWLQRLRARFCIELARVFTSGAIALTETPDPDPEYARFVIPIEAWVACSERVLPVYGLT